METSCKNLVQENQDVVRDLMAEDEDEVEISPTSSTLHILDLPDSVIFQILTYLPFSSIGAVAQVCSRFSRISSDELLWRHIFLLHYKLPVSTVMPTKARSWRQEFKRLYYHTPAVLSEERKEHKDEVLHVSFSHDGTMFVTCSKDGFFKVWECTHPVRLLFKMDMKSTFSWKFTQFSQFNETDTCLLVSGVYFGRLSTSGEIAVFNLQDDFRMQCRVTNKPYDVFGAWYDNDHLLSGTLYWTGDFNSVSAVWLSKASQEVESEVESVSMVLYRFENVNSSSIRLLHVAEVDRDSDTSESAVDKEELEVSESAQTSNSSSLGFGDEGKVNMELESARNRSEVVDKGQDQEKMAVEEPCILDLLLQRCIAEDEFDLENEDKTDNDEEGDDFHVEVKTNEGSDEMDFTNGPGTSVKLTSDETEDVIETVQSGNEITCNVSGASGVEFTVGADEVYTCSVPLQKLFPEQAGGDSACFHESACCVKSWPSSHSEVSDINMEPDLAQITAGDSPLESITSRSLKSCECSPRFKAHEKQFKTSAASIETHDFNIPQCNVVAGSKTSTLNQSTLSSRLSSNISADSNLSAPFSIFPSDNPFVWSSYATNNNAIAPAQEFESILYGSHNSLPGPLTLPLPSGLANRIDPRTSDASVNDSGEADGAGITDFSNITSEMNVDFNPESAVEIVAEHVDISGDDLGGISESFNVADVTSVSDMAPVDLCEGASASESIPEYLNHNHNDRLTPDNIDICHDFEGSSVGINAVLDVASALQNRPSARDVSLQFGHGFVSRDASVLNVPSMFDNNLVMLIPGASHVYGSGNRGIATYNINTNSSNVSNNNASTNVESSSGIEIDLNLAQEAGTSHCHKSSIATQTEIASSRASSFHSLSHMSQSSSISRDFRCSPPREKLLIYTWGSETYIPHKVGIKRMKWTDFTKGEVTARRSSMLLPDVMENLHNMAGNRRDKPDVTIEMHGHIVGLSLSPDHKYLYVNCRPWPKNYIISDPQESPPLAQEVEISTIDLTTFNFVGPVLRSHKAYTHSDECFFLNLDVSDDYVASGAEDRQGYLWDRHYGIPLYRFPHRNVVNCVAINPQDSEILVTVSDDYTFKVWMSRSRASELTGSSDGTSV